MRIDSVILVESESLKVAGQRKLDAIPFPAKSAIQPTAGFDELLADVINIPTHPVERSCTQGVLILSGIAH